MPRYMRALAIALVLVQVGGIPAIFGARAQGVGPDARQRLQAPANHDPDAFWELKEAEGFSFAGGARLDERPYQIRRLAQSVRFIRIGLNPTRFASGGDVLREFDTSTEQRHARIRLTATGDFALLVTQPNPGEASPRPSSEEALCGESVSLLAFGQLGEEITFEAEPEGIRVQSARQGPLGIWTVPLCAVPLGDALLQVLSLRRRNLNRVGNPLEPPLYRGALVILPAGPMGMRLINVLDLEAYLQGVITNEMPASFHREALRAHAVAARTFALANVGRFADRGFDLDDSTSSQVYRGVISEHPNGTSAVQSTRGLVVVRDGALVPTFYSSSMGGHTESVEWIFNSPPESLPGENAHPALHALHDADFPVPVDLTTEEGAFLFYSQTWDHFDSPHRSGNPRYRWVVNRSVEFIAERLEALYGLRLGAIWDLVVMQRSPSGRIVELHIVGQRGTRVLRGWRALRDFFQLFNSPSAIVPQRDATGSVRSFDLYGGGWGHNVGMSQYGAHGRGRSGQTFIQILTAYYAGSAVVSVENPLP